MKLSVSIPADELVFIDSYAEEHNIGSRSGVIQRALALLRTNDLDEEYAAAWAEWATSDAPAWDSALADGIDDAPPG